MTMTEIGIIGSIGIAFVGLLYKFSLDTDNKVKRTYKRLDENKEHNNEKFTNKEVCNVLHRQIDSKLTEISMDIKELIKMNGHNK